jgi:hypothetical protein
LTSTKKTGLVSEHGCWLIETDQYKIFKIYKIRPKVLQRSDGASIPRQASGNFMTSSFRFLHRFFFLLSIKLITQIHEI